MVGPPAQRDPVDSAATELRRLREKQGLTLAQLAERAHYSRGQLSKVENGASRLTPELAAAVDRALNTGGVLARLVAPRQPQKNRWKPLEQPVDLPPPARVFIGREDELATVVSALSSPASQVVVVHGAPGSGKTQLVLQAASRLLRHYPDGCVFLDLHAPAMDSHEAMDRILRRLGLPAEAIPLDPTERVSHYRRILRDRRLLLVLDNPARASDVLALVPPNAGGVLVAARAPWQAMDESTEVWVGPLPEDRARTLFIRIAGGRYAGADPALITRAVRACACLPLAVRIAAARLRRSPRLTLDALVNELERPDTLLSALDDGTRSVLNTFADACASLPETQRTLFAFLALHPGNSFDVWSAALVAGMAPPAAARALDGLLDASLLESVATDRYRFHELVRTVAVHCAEVTLTAADRDAAVSRLLAGFLAAVQQADVAVTPGRYRPPAVRPPDGAPAAPFGSAREATAWLDRQESTAVRLVELAAERGDHDVCWRLAYALRDHFFRTMARDAWVRTHSVALPAARATEDWWAIAVTLNNLGLARAMCGRPDAADQCYAEALGLFCDHKDTYGQANTLGHLAWTAYQRGNHTIAIDRATAALAIYREHGASRNIGITLQTLALAEAALGHAPTALAHLNEALQLFVDSGLALNEAMVLNCLGDLLADDPAAALRSYIRAWRRARTAGSRYEQARALRGMASCADRVGRHKAAERLRAHAAVVSGA